MGKKAKAILIVENDNTYSLFFVDHPKWRTKRIPTREHVDVLLKMLNHKIVKTCKRSEL